MLEDRIINSSKKSIMRMVMVTFFAFFTAILIAFVIIYITAQKRYSVIYFDDILKRATHTKSIQIRNYFEADLAILNAMSKSPTIIDFLTDKSDSAVQERYWQEFNSYKRLIGPKKNMFFVSKSDHLFFFDTNYAYTVNEQLSSAYWFDSTLSKTVEYNFNVDFDPNIGKVFIWINFPVFNSGKAVGILGMGIDIDSFAGELEKSVGKVDNFIVFNESGEILLHKNHSLIKNKNIITSIMPDPLVDKLLEIAREGSSELFSDDGSAYMIERLPFMQSHLIASVKTDFVVGLGNIYLFVFAFILAFILAFLMFLYKFVKTVVNPLHYFSSLTRTILREVPIHIAVFGGSGKITFISRQMNEMITKETAELYKYLREVETKDGFFETTKKFEMIDGSSSYFRIVKMNIEQYTNSKEQHSIVYLSNVSEQMYLANTDSLTNIANRRHFSEQAKTNFYSSQRDKTPIAFLMLDIDFFKNFNDKFGHLAGDVILKEIAKIMSRIVERKTDLIGRFGGEEFVVMLHNTNVEGAKVVADKIRSAVEEYEFMLTTIESIKITVSIGVYSNVPTSTDDVDSFLNEADKKLYEAKNAGRNMVCY